MEEQECTERYVYRTLVGLEPKYCLLVVVSNTTKGVRAYLVSYKDEERIRTYLKSEIRPATEQEVAAGLAAL